MKGYGNILMRLLFPLGGIGVLLYYILAILLVCAPLCVLNLPWWVDCLFALLILNFPVVSYILRIALYIWAAFSLPGAKTAAVVVYSLSLAEFVFLEVVPLVYALATELL